VQDNRVSRRYAQALFTTAQRHDVITSVEDDLNGIVDVIEADAGFRRFVQAPFTGREEKIRIFERIFADRITAITMQLLRVMLEKHRENEITQVRDEFVRLRRESQSVTLVNVTSSQDLDLTQRQALVAKMEAVLGRRVEASYHIDPAVIGGVKVAYENFVLDGTVRGTLSKLRERMKYDLLKQV